MMGMCPSALFSGKRVDFQFSVFKTFLSFIDLHNIFWLEVIHYDTHIDIILEVVLRPVILLFCNQMCDELVAYHTNELFDSDMSI